MAVVIFSKFSLNQSALDMELEKEITNPVFLQWESDLPANVSC